MIHIAYGSNMVREQMARRCPEAVLLGTGVVRGARLEFYRHATLEPTGDPRDVVPVAIWALSASDEANLDAYEEVPAYYAKEIWRAERADGSQIEGMVYIMRQITPLPPSEAYYRGIEEAYRALGMQAQIETILRPALGRSRAR